MKELTAMCPWKMAAAPFVALLPYFNDTFAALCVLFDCSLQAILVWEWRAISMYRYTLNKTFLAVSLTQNSVSCVNQWDSVWGIQPGKHAGPQHKAFHDLF